MTNIAKTIAALGVVAGLGVAALPLSSYAANTADVNVTTTVNSAISLSLDQEGDDQWNAGTSTLTVGAVTPGGAPSEASVNAKITTNSGYVLNAKTSTEETAMKNSAESIPAGTPTQGQSYWGVKADTAGGGEDSYKTLSNTDTQLAAQAKTVAGTDLTTKLTFGVSANAEQIPGSYSVSVVLTATAQV